MASAALSRRPSSSNRAAGHSSSVSGSTIAASMPSGGRAQRVGQRRHRRHDDRVLAGAVAGEARDAEPLAERPHVRRRRLGGQRELHPVVAVLGGRRGGEHVGQGPADRAEERGAVAAHVGHELRRRELRAQGDGGATAQGRQDDGVERVAVEERHGAVEHVVGTDPAGAAWRPARRGRGSCAPPSATPVEPEVKIRTNRSSGVGAPSEPRVGSPNGSSTRCTGVPPRSRPSSRSAWAASVRTTWQSVWVMSRTSSAPRRVSLMPTSAAPARAAPKSVKR